LSADSLAKTLASSCSVSFYDGVNQFPSQKTNWGQADPKTLLRYLKDYRAAPGQTNPDATVREALHHFLFAARTFDAPFTAALGGNPIILVDGPKDAEPFIVNIPWELADSVRTRNELLCPYVSLAAHSLARTIRGNQSPFRLKEITRLQVLYCISEPAGATPINAETFYTLINQALQDRSGLLDFRAVEGGFRPRFDRLLGEITSAPPHLLIIACHGQTNKNGSSLLFDGWKPVSALADALTANLNTFLVLLIACDQTYTESPSAQSAALVLLEKGIPFVVAMQSSVNALLASTFLRTVIDGLFLNGSIPRSVAAGRIQMAPNSNAAEKMVDWTFPALFAAENVAAQDFSRFLKGYVPALEHLLRRIPVSTPYLSRTRNEDWIRAALPSSEHGIKIINSTSGRTGTSSLIRHVCRTALEKAIKLEDTSIRPILYVDFDAHDRSLETITDLLGILRNETEVTLRHLGTHLFGWPAPRGSDGAAQSTAMPELLACLDQNKMVLVLDNVDAKTSPLLLPLIKDAPGGLLYSLLLIVTEQLNPDILDAGSMLTVGPFSLDEVQGYLNKFEPTKSREAKEWYDDTGGFPFLLDQSRRTDYKEQGVRPPRQSDESIEVLKRMLSHGIDDKARELAYTLVHFPKGLDANFASEFLGEDWRNAEDLVARNLVLREYRSGQSEFWARLPQKVSEAIRRGFPEQASAAQDKVAGSFQSRFEGMTADQMFATFQQILTTPGGIGFLHDIHKVLLRAEYSEAARALPVMVHEWLFEHGRWYDCYEFWKRLLRAHEGKEFEAHEWLKFAKAAHVLGLTSEARDALGRARESNPNAIDRVDLLSTDAALIKDSANFGRGEELLKMYVEALSIIETALASNGCDRPSLEEKRALVHYDRSLVRAFWSLDLPGALEDLDFARTTFERLGRDHMRALADCEWVDVQLHKVADEQHIQTMLGVLFKAAETFSQGVNAGDHAFCLYQIARCYRRFAELCQDDRDYDRKSAMAYQQSAEMAGEAGDFRQEAISRAHAAEVRWQRLKEMDASEAQAVLDGVVKSLSTFQSDAWSTRVRRNTLLLQAQIVPASAGGNRLHLLQRAWETAREAGLHAKDRATTDARRAAQGFLELIQELQTSNLPLEPDKTLMSGKEYVQAWLERQVDILKPDTWSGDLRQYCKQQLGG
jgi:hypothetical protein